jgi:pimeloyl-ACP methyl ester carboxylesterase
MRRRIRWRYVGAFAAVLAVLAVRPAAAHLRAASLLVRFTDPAAHGVVADADRYDVREEPGSVDAEGGPVRARWYFPVGVMRPPGVVILHGVHRLGVGEPRLARFARTIAATGVAVLTPEIRELCDFRIDPKSVVTIGNAAHTLRARLGAGAVGVMGLSFSGGLGIIAAADPRYRDDVAFVVAVGAHDDLGRVLRYFATDEDPLPEGGVQKLKAHDYGPLVLVYDHVESFFPPEDVLAARDALRAWLWEDFDTARERAQALSPPSRDKIDRLFSHDTASIAPELLAEVERNASALAAVSPRTYLPNLRAPLYLLHGAGDNVIPAAETRWLAHDAPPGILRDTLVSPALQHVELEGEPSVFDQLALVHFMSDLLREADAETR